MNEKCTDRFCFMLLHVASTPVLYGYLKCRAIQQVVKVEKKRARSGAPKNWFRVA